MRDYFLICESYYSAIKTASPSRIEAIDMGRRALHNEGSELLQQRLKDKVAVDFDTARPELETDQEFVRRNRLVSLVARSFVLLSHER